MQGIKQILKTSEQFVTNNSPALLTAVGVVGTLSTAVLSARAHVQATDVLRKAEAYQNEDNGTYKDLGPLTFQDKTRLTWKLYIPPVSIAAITCTSIICANRIGTRRAAVLAAAYATSEKAYDEYKDKVIEKFGENKEREVRDEVAADQLKKNPLSQEALASAPEDRDWFYDARCGRYFQSTIEDVKAAQNHINYILNQEGDVSLNTFYSWLGVNTVPDGEELGWRADKGLVELTFSSHLMENGRPATVLNFRLQPIRNYDSAYGA